MDEQKIRTMAQQIAQQAIDQQGNLSTFSLAQIPFHTHTGQDSSRVSFPDLANKTMAIAYTIPGTNATTAANYSTFFTAPFPLSVSQMTEVHAVKGTDGSGVTLQIEKLTGTTVPGSGIALLTTAFNLKSTINTVVTGTPSVVVGAVQLAAGDRLALVLGGNATSVANVTVTLILRF